MKKVHIRTYGCQMNVYDSERMTRSLAHHGYAAADGPDDADLVILNTCHIREKAAEKVYSELGRLRVAREARRARGDGDTLLAVAGCVAQAEGQLLVERAPFVDIVVGPQVYHRLPELLARRARGEGAVVDTEFPPLGKFDELPTDVAPGGPCAFLTVQEGCDKFCTFCVVPYTRGAEASRPVAAVVDEARRLADAGVREVTLLGQNVNAYHGQGPDGRSWGLARLARELADRVPGLARIRYTTSHPRDMGEDLIRAHGEVPALMPFLHLPVQSGSDGVLKAMNRRGTAAEFLAVVDRLREARPDIALSSDFIVGFPGERDADFEATLDLVRRVGFAQAFSFKYSPRPGTPASTMPGQVPERAKAERLKALQDLLDGQARAFNEACLGRALPVLLDRPGRHPGQLVGRSPYLQAVHVDAADLGGAAIGDVVDVLVDAVNAHSLAGGPPPAPRQAMGSPSPEDLGRHP